MMEVHGPEFKRNLEDQLALELRTVLAEVPVGSEFTVLPFSDLCYSLELFIPKIFSRHHPEWANESLDGVFVARARKTGPASAELAGTCILIRDQTVTPLLIELAVSPTSARIEFFRVCLGEPGGGNLGISGPACNSRGAKELLANIASRLGSIAWSYSIASDESRPYSR